MPATREGGLKAAITNKAKYGEDFYKRIGATGGAKSRGGGFAYDHELARLAGRLGGLKSRKYGTGKELDKNVLKEAKQDVKYYKIIKLNQGE